MRRVESGKIRKALSAAVLASVGVAIVGCTGKNEMNGFLDPTAVGRFDDKRPLVVPILSHLDVGMEEANSEFQSATEIRPEDLVSHPEDYKISANDLLTITISDLVGPGAEQVATRRVTETGRVSLPMLGQVKAEGRTEAELEKDIRDAYKDAGLIQSAQVSVTITEARGRTFSITGDGTQHPGQYPMYKGDFRVLDALVASAGTVPFSDTMYVVRSTATEKAEATTKPTEGALAPAAEPGSNLEPGANLEPSQPKAAPAPVPAPAPAPAVTQPAPAATKPAAAGAAPEGRIVIIDGKPVLIEGGQTQPATSKPAPAGGKGMAAAPAAAPTPAAEVQPQVSDEKFEFNRLMNENQRIIRVSLKGLRMGDMKNNIVIRPGDTLFVPGPVVGEYYMGGHVNRPGVYSLSGRDVTLTQAIISAGMFDQIAIPRRTEVRRRLGPDREVLIGVDLDSVFAGTEPDVYLKPNDVVNVGTNALAPFLASIRGGFRMTYGFGFLYDRNFAARANNAGLGNNQ